MSNFIINKFLFSSNNKNLFPSLLIFIWNFLFIFNLMKKIDSMPIEENKQIYLATILRNSDGQAALLPLENEKLLLRFFAEPIIEKQRKRRRDLNSIELLARQQEQPNFLA
ncbi:hypothetical protein Mgra_00000243 [Meloidogyne graminicola]|uniref:Uncharacterized protein n=1 Tax=Meloidogyne graminicola TaxID=189291 RepID=A0A8T0A698_9BILA|nr:hypothetical protein Mgra_00000243 [Meloidogyne graminicola]